MFKSALLLTLALTAFSFSGFSWVKIHRYDRGIFGYKDVTASYSGPNSILSCANPGWRACAWRNGTAGGTVIDNNGTVVVIDDIQPIEDAVMPRISKDNLSGSFYHGSDLYVKYAYEADGDHLVMEIYSLYEAHKLGLI